MTHLTLLSTVSAAVIALCVAALALAQEDKFAKCPNPEAARKYVQQCLSANPYNSKETCESLALEKLCSGGETKKQ